MSHTSNEFIYFDPEFSGEFGDFTDDSVFTAEQRSDFLSNYAKFLKNSYLIPSQSQYAVEKFEVINLLKTFETGSGVFSKMQAFKGDMPSKYSDWILYTQKAVVVDDKLILKNASLPPNPNAIYKLHSQKKLEEIHLRFKMDSEFKAENHGIIRDTTTGRTIELRNGIEDILKIGFYQTGECYARHFSTDPYHSKFIKIGDFLFDKENDFKLSLHDNCFDVFLNDNFVGEIPYNCSLSPDTLFFSSGMFHFGDWEIEPVSIKYSDEIITEFFVKQETKACEKTFIGEVNLPYSIGCYENRDKQLIFEKEFELPDTPYAELIFDSLDPGGEVYIDDQLEFSTDGFDDFRIDVSNLDRNKKHLLQVRVFPRAPETLFAWHRQKDSYNGWFCGEINLKGYGEIRLNNLTAVTKKVYSNKAEVIFSGETNKKCRVVISAEQIFGGYDSKECIAQIDADGSFEVKAIFDANIWDTNNPNIYNVNFTAYEGEIAVASESIETGFRTIEQKKGEIRLNGKRVDLKGTLLMQFLPPYTKTSESHICSTDEQILWQEMMVKALGGNTLRLHILGYGTNDARYARYADRLGLLLIWTTRYIDSIESVQWQGKWRGEDAYLRQIKKRTNHPSIIMWEGSNEFRPNIKQINDAFDKFVPAIKTIDTSRLICPISHLYYAADLYPTRGCEFLSTDGLTDHNGEPVNASPYWNDSLVVRSAHTYNLLCGYGTGWDKMRTQSWNEQNKLLESKENAYIVSEYAVIGRQDPNTKEATEDYFNTYSYEFPDEKPLGIHFAQDNWEISQAYQALCAYHTTKRMRTADVDGLLWCCLMGGANDGGYLKPVIDNYGYAKLGFYTMKTAFQEEFAFVDGVDTKIGKSFSFRSVFFGQKGRKYDIHLSIVDTEDNIIEEFTYKNIVASDKLTYLPIYNSKISNRGYYGIRFMLNSID